MSKKKDNKVDPVTHEENYVYFLKKRLASKNFRETASEEEIKKTEKKYDKAKLKLKMLRQGLL